MADWALPRRDEGFYRAFCSLYRQPGGPPARWVRGLDRELARLKGGPVSPLQSIRESLDALGVSPAE